MPNPENPQQQVGVFLDERDLKTSYCNTYRLHNTAQEVIVELGFQMGNPNPNPQGPQMQVLMKMTDRVVLSYYTAKALSNSLIQLVKRYEQQYGEVTPPPGLRR